MEIETTITVEKDGVVILETDVIACIDWDTDEYGELHWRVDEYCAESGRDAWDDTARVWISRKKRISIPEPLATVFDAHLNREAIDKEVRRYVEYEGISAPRYDEVM